MQLSDIEIGLHVAVKVGSMRQRVIVDAIHAPEGARLHYEVSVRRPGSSRVLKRVAIAQVHTIGATYLPLGPNGDKVVDAPSTEDSRAQLRRSNYPIPLVRSKCEFLGEDAVKAHIDAVGVEAALYDFK